MTSQHAGAALQLGRQEYCYEEAGGIGCTSLNKDRLKAVFRGGEFDAN